MGVNYLSFNVAFFKRAERAAGPWLLSSGLHESEWNHLATSALLLSCFTTKTHIYLMVVCCFNMHFFPHVKLISWIRFLPKRHVSAQTPLGGDVLQSWVVFDWQPLYLSLQDLRSALWKSSIFHVRWLQLQVGLQAGNWGEWKADASVKHSRWRTGITTSVIEVCSMYSILCTVCRTWQNHVKITSSQQKIFWEMSQMWFCVHSMKVDVF